jgi:serine/threonine protein kinase
MQCLLQERAVLLSSGSHPFVLQIVATYRDTSRLYLLTELVNGMTLADWLATLKKDGSFSGSSAKKIESRERVAKFFIANIVAALKHLHGHCRVIHRDIKAENVMIGEDGYLKLIDFGIATLLRGPQAYTVCGTKEYMAPEMLRGYGYGFEVDHWCCGILVHELLTGRTPFYDEDEYQCFRKIMKGFRWDLDMADSTALSDVPRDFVARSLAHWPSERLGHSRDAREHAWLADMNWKALLAKSLPAPFVPGTLCLLEPEADLKQLDAFEGDAHKSYLVAQFAGAVVTSPLAGAQGGSFNSTFNHSFKKRLNHSFNKRTHSKRKSTSGRKAVFSVLTQANGHPPTVLSQPPRQPPTVFV